MIDKGILKVGDEVYYQPSYYREREWENGIVKEIPTHTDESVRVVYNYNNERENFKDYTAALTSLSDLHLGWKCGRNDKLNKYVEPETNCYKCKHEQKVPGNEHIMCTDPDSKMTGDSHGIKNGWFIYPVLFDPIWRTKECDNFEEK